MRDLAKHRNIKQFEEIRIFLDPHVQQAAERNIADGKHKPQHCAKGGIAAVARRIALRGHLGIVDDLRRASLDEGFKLLGRNIRHRVGEIRGFLRILAADEHVKELGVADLLRGQDLAQRLRRVAIPRLCRDLREHRVADDDIGIGADQFLRGLQVAAGDVVDILAAAGVIDINRDACLIERRDKFHGAVQGAAADDQHTQDDQPPFF